MPASPPPTLCNGRYRLGGILGEGGMSVVYRAWDEALRVERAIKLLAPGAAAHPEARARIETEARAMASLRHPNVVAVHDIREDGDQVFLVMELVTGGTLWDWVGAHGPMPPRLAVEVLLPVIDAVEAAHAAGVVHRDLKPGNILLDAEGRPKVSDFGIARICRPADGAAWTRTGTTLGTWAFMAPEQRRDSRSADPRSDVYSLAATLYALIRGQLPFDLYAAGEDASLLEDIPAPLASVIRTGTRFRPSDRFRDARALRDAIGERLGDLDPISADTPSLGVRAARGASADEATADMPGSAPPGPTTTAGPALRVLANRRRFPGFPDEEPDEVTAPGLERRRWLTAAISPALVALLVGAAVLAFAGRNQGTLARRTLALTGAASVALEGEVAEAWLTDEGGRRQPIGSVRPGAYAVRVRFHAGEPEATVVRLDLAAGQIVDLACDPAARRCTAATRD